LKPYLQKSITIIRRILPGIMGVFLLLLLLIHFPFVQRFAKNQAVVYLQNKIKTTVQIDTLSFGLFQPIRVKGLFLADQKKDTLIAGRELNVDINWLDLASNQLTFSSIALDGITIKVDQNNRGKFNFDYILKAFESTDPPKESSSNAMAIVLQKIKLNQVRLVYQQAKDPLQTNIKIKHFDTQFQTFDLENQIVAIPKINLVGLTATISQTLTTSLQKIAPNAIVLPPNRPWKVSVGEIDLKKVHVDYAESSQKMKGQVSFRRWYTKLELLDLANELVVINKTQFENLRGAVSLGKTTSIAAPSTETPQTKPNAWEVKIKQTEVAQLFFQWDNHNVNPITKGLDFNHLQLKNSHFKAKNFHYTSQSIAANIVAFAGKEQSGLQIDSLHTDFFYGPRNSYLKKLYLKTPQTVVRNEVLVGYPSIAQVAKNPKEISIKANISNSKLGFKDVLLLAPQLAKTNPFDSNPNGILILNSVVSGKLNRLEIPNLELSGIGNTKLKASGRILGLPDMDKAQFDIALQNFESTAKDIAVFAPKGSLPKNVTLPSKLSAKGSFKGTMHSFLTDLALQSSFGSAKVKATFDQSIKNQPKYNAQAEWIRFDLGQLLQQKALGKISAKTKITGTGFDPKTAKIKTSGTISNVMYNQYTYQNFGFSATANNGFYTTQATINDANLSAKIDANGDWKDKFPKGTVKLNLDIADLEKLHLHAGPLKLKGEMDASILAADLNFLTGTVTAHHLVVTNEKGSFPIDSIAIQTAANAEKTTLTLDTGFLEASIEGGFQWSAIGGALERSLRSYFSTQPIKTIKPGPAQQFSFHLATKESPIFGQLVPNLKEMAPVTISGNYQSVSDSLALQIQVPKLALGDQVITNATFDLNTANKALHYQLQIAAITNPQMQLPMTVFAGKVANNQIDYALQVKDVNNKERYSLAGAVNSEKDELLLHFVPNSVLLNYENWALPENNLIRLSPKGLTVSDFGLENKDSNIRIASQSAVPNAPLEIAFENFNISTLTSMVEKDDWQMSGNVNGAVLLKKGITQPLFTSDIKIEDFSFKKDTVGTISIQVKNENENLYLAEVTLTGQDNKATLLGNYESKSGDYGVTLALDQLNMKSIQGFAMGQLTQSTGFLSGSFEASKNKDASVMNGKLQFNQVGFKVKPLNATFHSLNDAITYDGQNLMLDHLTIKDEKGNNLIVDGAIKTEVGKNMAFDISIEADNFKAINSKATDNDLFYGELFLNNHITIQGDTKNPKIAGVIQVNKETKFTIVVPQSDPSIADREGIVEFIDQDHPTEASALANAKDLNQSEIMGFNASMDIVIDKEAELTLIMDKTTGDYVKAKGKANLSGGIDESGKTTLTGKYELDEGVYELSFSGIKRKFDIKKGSYILWKGDPMDADVNVTAVYKVNTAPIDLVLNEISNFSETEKTTFKEKIPFETELKITGEILKPEVDFDITLPDNNSVSSKVMSTTKAKLEQLRQEPNDMNKQVFALLVLGNFIGDNPLSSESGFSAASMARGSASKILSNQLNNLAGDLIKGVELNFDVQSTEDYSSGSKDERTDLNIGISKKLFKDRVKITVGSSFGLEGNQQANEKATNIAGDVSIDYQITKDGRYKIRGYRINKYQVALQGEVLETGVSFIITMDYNKFKELFQKSK